MRNETSCAISLLEIPRKRLPTRNRSLHPASDFGVGFGRRLEKKWLQVARQFLELIVDADERLGVLRGDTCRILSRLVAIGPPGHHSAIGEGDLDRGIARNHAQSVFGQAARSRITSGRSMLAM